MKVYIDTSVINGLFADDAPWIKKATRIFFETIKQKNYDVFISDLVIAELERTPNLIKRKKLLNIISQYSFKQIRLTEEAERLAQKYIDNAIIPHKYLPDALHLSLVSIYRIPVIVSWNFKHLVRHKTRIMVNKINKKFNYIEIDICSPEEVD